MYEKVMRMAEIKSADERRRWPRLPVAIPVFASGVDKGGKEFHDFTTLLDISAGGARLAIRRHLPPSARLTIEIPSAPMSELATDKNCSRTFRGRIVQVMTSDRGQLYGVKFNRPLVKMSPGLA